MTLEIGLVLGTLAMAVALFVTEKVRVDVVALMVLLALAFTGLVEPREALSGFSSPAVVTVWAVFILSGGLTRTGVASRLGHLVLRLAGRRELGLVVAFMLTAGLLSAFMNTAVDLGLSPHTLLMTVAVSASASFTSPVAHPANILIMGPGGHRFTDYIKVGLPLTLLCLTVVLIVLPLVWPF